MGQLSSEKPLFEIFIWMYQTGKLSKNPSASFTQKERFAFDRTITDRILANKLTGEIWQWDLQALKHFNA